MGANDVPLFWFLDPGFLIFCAVIAAIAGVLKILGKL